MVDGLIPRSSIMLSSQDFGSFAASFTAHWVIYPWDNKLLWPGYFYFGGLQEVCQFKLGKKSPGPNLHLLSERNHESMRIPQLWIRTSEEWYRIQSNNQIKIRALMYLGEQQSHLDGIWSELILTNPIPNSIQSLFHYFCSISNKSWGDNVVRLYAYTGLLQSNIIYFTVLTPCPNPNGLWVCTIKSQEKLQITYRLSSVKITWGAESDWNDTVVTSCENAYRRKETPHWQSIFFLA